MDTTIQKLLKYPAVIKLFLKYSKRNFTVREISRETMMPYATTWRYIQKLEQSGIIFIEKIGGYNVCKLNRNSPLIDKLKEFLDLELSPHRLAAKEFTEHAKKIKGIEQIILFGSVAKGEEKLTSDVDIALIAKKDKRIENKIIVITKEILEKTQISIIPIILDKKEVKEKSQLAEELGKGEVLYERAKRS